MLNLSTIGIIMADERSSNQGERRPYNKSRGPRPEEKKINTEQVISYLSHAFMKASQKVQHLIGNRNHKGTKLYRYQVEFCYLMDEIQRGPAYILPKIIQDANQLIISLERETSPTFEDEQ
jgi:hypothetical protein